MKTADEILTEVHRELNATYIEANIMSDTPVGDRKEVTLEAMKRYALEVSKEALRKASNNVKLGISEYRTREDVSIGWVVTENKNLFIINDGCNVCATEESILSEDNIPKEVKS